METLAALILNLVSAIHVKWRNMSGKKFSLKLHALKLVFESNLLEYYTKIVSFCFSEFLFLFYPSLSPPLSFCLSVFVCVGLTSVSVSVSIAVRFVSLTPALSNSLYIHLALSFSLALCMLIKC